MNDSLIYDNQLEEVIDFFSSISENTFPEFLEYGGPLLKKGKQGLVGYLQHKKTNDKYVYKISQYLDYMIDQEHNVLKDLNTIRDYCPHFVKLFHKLKIPITSNYTKAKNPFQLSNDYKSIITEVLLIQNLDQCKKFAKYIKNKDYSTDQMISIVKQSLLATIIANQKVNFTHYDLHSDNILLKECNPNSVFVYIMNDEYHIVPTYGLYPIIIDFGFSYSKNCDDKPMNCSLAHTKYGFIQHKEDVYADPKLFLPSVSYEIKKYKRDKKSFIFRNIVKNIYKKANIDLECGWDNTEGLNVNDEFIDIYKNTFKKSEFFNEQVDYILDILQTLIVLPLKYRKTRENTKELLSLFINEYKKIEKVISDDFYNLYILKIMISSVNTNRDIYMNEVTRKQSVTNFKNDILEAIDRVAQFCNPKLNWEKLLCTLLCLGKNIENFFYERMTSLNKQKQKFYSKIPLDNSINIYNAIEANLPSHFLFDKDTVLYIWNVDKENSIRKGLDQNIIDILNETHPFERGDVLKEYLK